MNSAAPKLSPASASGHIIAVVGGKGGVGKSVFSANLALSLMSEGKMSVALVDADPQGSGDLNLILGVKQVKGYGDTLLDGKVSDGAALKAMMTQLGGGGTNASLHVLQLSSSPERLLVEDEERADAALKMIRKSFAVTVVDCGSRLEGVPLKVLDLASLILVVTNPDVLVLNQTRKIVDKLQTLLIPAELVKLVVNKTTANTPYTPAFIEQSLKRQVLANIADDPAALMAALAKGAPYVAAAPQSPATKSLVQFSRAIVEKKVLEQLASLQRAPKPKVALKPNATPEGEGASTGGPKVGKEPSDARSLFKVRMHDQLVDKLDLKREALDTNPSATKIREQREKATKILVELLAQEDHPFKSREESAKLIKEILDETFGLGPLEDLLSDDKVSEIMVNRADRIYIEKGGLMLSPITFSSNKQLMTVIERIVSGVGRRINESTPYVDARLKDGSRVHAIIPPLALDGPMLTIRKFPKKRLGPQDLVGFGSMSDKMAVFLQACIKARLNVIVSGGTGSGKTTLLNVLSSFIPVNERILTVEDSAELQLGQDHVGRLETRPPSLDGSNGVTIRDLVKQTLRMRPDRIIIGEVRDGAALDLLQAMNTGHDGSMATIHANNPREALSRMETLVMMSGMDLPLRAIREQISGAIHLFVQQSRLLDGSRKVMSITEVAGMEGEVIKTSPIFEFKVDKIEVGADGKRKVLGRHVATGFMPTFFSKLQDAGIKLPPDLFKA